MLPLPMTHRAAPLSLAPLSPTLLEEGPEVEKDTVVGWGWGWGRSHHATWVFLNHCN